MHGFHCCHTKKAQNCRHMHELTCKHSMEVGAAGGQDHFVRLDFFVGNMEHDVTQQPALTHPVHGHEGVVVVAF